jgi:hypothetical protein
VAEIRRERRHAGADVGAGALPVDERVDREAVPLIPRAG